MKLGVQLATILPRLIACKTHLKLIIISAQQCLLRVCQAAVVENFAAAAAEAAFVVRLASVWF